MMRKRRNRLKQHVNNYLDGINPTLETIIEPKSD